MNPITDQILSKVDITNIVGQYVKLKRAGVNFTGLCPFHNEKTPSFVVSPHKQIFKCFGCGEGGNAIAFVSKIERMDRRDTVKKMAADYNVSIPDKNFDNETIQQSSDQKEKIKLINKYCQNFFLENYTKSSSTVSYLKDKRKLSDDIIVKFGLGYSPDSFSALIQYLKSKGFTDDDLVEASIAKIGNHGDSYAFFRNRLMIPIRDSVGNIVAFGARALVPDDNPKYLNTAETIVYNKSNILYGINFLKDNIKKTQKVIIVEGYMDVIALNKAGFETALATCGTALTKGHIDIIKRYTENVYLLFDSDKAGQQATIRGIKLCYELGIFPRVIVLPEGSKDIDDLVRDQDLENSKRILNGLTDGSQESFGRILSNFAKGFDLTSPSDKKRYIGEVFEVIHSCSSAYSIQQEYLETFANSLDRGYDTMFAEYKQFCKNIPIRQKRQNEESSNTGNKRKLDFKILLQAVVDEDFLSKQGIESDDFFVKLVEILHRLGIYEPKDQKSGNITILEGGQDLESMQIWREQELVKIDDVRVQRLFIQKTVLKFMSDLVAEQIKIGNLSTEEKMGINKLFMNIKKVKI